MPPSPPPPPRPRLPRTRPVSPRTTASAKRPSSVPSSPGWWARGLLSQRDAISASLRARDQGTTFLAAIAQINTLAGDIEFYQGLAEEAGLAFIANDRELVQMLGEAEWLTFKEADQRGCLLLKPDARWRRPLCRHRSLRRHHPRLGQRPRRCSRPPRWWCCPPPSRPCWAA